MSGFDERLEKYVAGELSPDERAAFEDEVLADPELADRLYADVNVSEAIKTAATARRERGVQSAGAAPWWRRPMFRWLVPAAAAAAIAVVVLVQPDDPERPPVMRGDEGQFSAIEPSGEVAAVPVRFAWTSSSGASFYRFELFDQSAVSVYQTVTADTLLVPPASISVPSRGHWTVTPLSDIRVGIGDALLTRYQTSN